GPFLTFQNHLNRLCATSTRTTLPGDTECGHWQRPLSRRSLSRLSSLTSATITCAVNYGTRRSSIGRREVSGLKGADMRRRELLKTAALGHLVAGKLAFGQAPRTAANDRIGVGNMGTTDLTDFINNPDVDVVAVCDVYEPNLENALKLTGGKAKVYRDYRRLLEDRNVQAVMIATPEHWHAIMCIDACEAGKDVYVEKPASHHIRDGRLAVEAARRNKRVVQVSTQQRSGAHFQRAVRYVQEGKIGEICYASVWTHFPAPRPRTPVTGGPPPGMDWEMWLGPAPKLPYDEVWNYGRNGYWDF